MAWSSPNLVMWSFLISLPQLLAIHKFPSLTGNMSASLFKLQHLQYLDLSYNHFSGNQIPSFIANLSKLRHLNLTSTLLTGEIPPQLGNLSNLQILDPKYNHLSIKNFDWISHLSSLRYLDLKFTNLREARDWMQTVNKLPQLTTLGLRGCYLPDITPPSLSSVNSSTSLAVLVLAYNNLSVSIHQWLFNFSSSLIHLDLMGNHLKVSMPKAFGDLIALEYLDLSYNMPEGEIPMYVGNMTYLRHLDLDKNKLEGEIPKYIWNSCTLRTLSMVSNNIIGQLPIQFTPSSSSECADYPLEHVLLGNNRIMGSLPNLTMFPNLKTLSVAANQLNGSVPESIGQLKQLEILDISGNSLEGVISEAHFSKLSKLFQLDLSSNSVTWNISPNRVPPFQLYEIISLGSCKLSPQFPKWLQTHS